MWNKELGMEWGIRNDPGKHRFESYSPFLIPFHIPYS